jgi:hypothetical protein
MTAFSVRWKQHLAKAGKAVFGLFLFLFSLLGTHYYYEPMIRYWKRKTTFQDGGKPPSTHDATGVEGGNG